MVYMDGLCHIPRLPRVAYGCDPPPRASVGGWAVGTDLLSLIVSRKKNLGCIVRCLVICESRLICIWCYCMHHEGLWATEKKNCIVHCHGPFWDPLPKKKESIVDSLVMLTILASGHR